MEIPKKKTKTAIRAAAKTAALICDEMKAAEIEILGVRSLFRIADYFVLATVQSERQSRAVFDRIKAEFRERGMRFLGVEGGGGWLLGDFDSVIVHVFTPEARGYYSIENLWGDAEKIKWK